MLRPWKMIRVYNRLKQMSFRTLWLSVRCKFPSYKVTRMAIRLELLFIQLIFPSGEVILPSGKVTHPSGRMRTSLSSLGLISPQMSSFSVKIFGLGTPLFHSEGMGPGAKSKMLWTLNNSIHPTNYMFFTSHKWAWDKHLASLCRYHGVIGVILERPPFASPEIGRVI